MKKEAGREPGTLQKIAAIRIERKKLEDLNPAEYNPRKRLMPGDDEYEKLRRSIETFTYVDPIIVNKDGTVIGGHQRLFVLRDMGYTEADVSVVDLSKNDEKALNIALNKISGEWDEDKLAEIFAELNTVGYDATVTGYDEDAIAALLGEIKAQEETANEYSQKIDPVQYEVTGDAPEVWELYSDTKYRELIMDIESDGSISEEEREFLKLAATRHIVFNYRNIAEYYAAAGHAMQGLMEDSALVIIDFDDAVKNGYAKIRGLIDEMMQEDEDDGE